MPPTKTETAPPASRTVLSPKTKRVVKPHASKMAPPDAWVIQKRSEAERLERVIAVCKINRDLGGASRLENRRDKILADLTARLVPKK